MIHEANRMKRLPPYLFTIVDNVKRKVRESGVDVIDFSMGNPDLPPPLHVRKALQSAVNVRDRIIHRYSKWDGAIERKLREAIAAWYHGRFSVELDPDTEILPLIGSKEGIAHLALTFLNSDDLALVPSPSYPVHFNGIIMAGGILYNIPLREENDYLPDLSSLSRETTRLSKLMILSYPHNPTTATCDLEFFDRVVHWAKDKNMIVAHDLAYSDFVFTGKRAPSILEAKGSRKFCIEFHTCSKSYCMPGWRIGFAVGNKDIIASLAKTKSYVDFGIFRGIQIAATKALTGPQDSVKKVVNVYKKRLDCFMKCVSKIDWKMQKPRATFYVWAKIPMKFSGLTSMEFCELLLREAGVAVAPGIGFGEYGEGHVRFALVEPEERIRIAFKRIKKVLEMEI